LLFSRIGGAHAAIALARQALALAARYRAAPAVRFLYFAVLPEAAAVFAPGRVSARDMFLSAKR